MWFAAISLLAIAVIAAIVVASHDRNSYRAAAIPNFQSVAVLPFANLSGDSSQEYLTDGITDELITQLARNTTVPIISRTSVMRYKNRQTPLPVVARELGIDAVIESSLQRTGSHFKISTHLIAATNKTPVWAASYEGDMKEVPQTVARIASEVGAILSRPASARSEHVPVPPVSADAYDEYLKGQFLWNAWQPLSALRHFQRVAALEPEFAAAYAGIAKSYCRLELTQVLPPSVAFPPASAAAEKALELDPHNSEGHAVRSYLYGQRDWDWNRAEQELKTAIAEDPGNSVGHRWYRYILHYKGRTEEALEQGRLALKADPASADLITAFAMELAHSKRYAEAIAAFSEAIEFAPEDDNIRFGLADAYEKTGKLNLAATELENGYTFGGEPDIADQIRKQLPTLGYQEAASAARRAQLLRQLDRLKKKSAQRKYVSPTAYTFVYAGLRDKENTLKWLDAAYAGDSHVMTQLRDETFDFVRQEPRFQKIWGNVPFSH
jgi:TolB-like protein/tetratricopeptide (TPR) repeat protein